MVRNHLEDRLAPQYLSDPGRMHRHRKTVPGGPSNKNWRESSRGISTKPLVKRLLCAKSPRTLAERVSNVALPTATPCLSCGSCRSMPTKPLSLMQRIGVGSKVAGVCPLMPGVEGEQGPRDDLVLPLGDSPAPLVGDDLALIADVVVDDDMVDTSADDAPHLRAALTRTRPLMERLGLIANDESSTLHFSIGKSIKPSKAQSSHLLTSLSSGDMRTSPRIQRNASVSSRIQILPHSLTRDFDPSSTARPSTSMRSSHTSRARVSPLQLHTRSETVSSSRLPILPSLTKSAPTPSGGSSGSDMCECSTTSSVDENPNSTRTTSSSTISSTTIRRGCTPRSSLLTDLVVPSSLLPEAVSCSVTPSDLPSSRSLISRLQALPMWLRPPIPLPEEVRMEVVQRNGAERSVGTGTQNRCTANDCRYQHVCSNCKSNEHPSKSCPNRNNGKSV